MNPGGRGLIVVSAVFLLAGAGTLLLTQLPAVEVLAAQFGMVTGHHTGEIPAYGPITGLATHPGPAIATLAAQLSPAAGPARIVAITRAPATPAARAGSP